MIELSVFYLIAGYIAIGFLTSVVLTIYSVVRGLYEKDLIVICSFMIIFFWPLPLFVGIYKLIEVKR